MTFMTPFTFDSTVRTHFGSGMLEDALRKELPSYGKRIMLAYGCGSVKRSGLYDRVRGLLEELGKEIVDFGGIMPNPTYAKVKEGAALAVRENVDFILAVGGGSVSDCAKIVAVQALSEMGIWTMEVREGRYPDKGIPVGVVVTASGTGSDQNSDAVITNENEHIKCDLYGILPEFAVLDPQLTMSVPMMQVMSGAFDSLSHAMETYFGRPGETFISDELNEAVMRNIIRNMRRVHENPEDIDARGELMWCSSLAENSILKLGKETDFQCHMIEHQLGAYTDCSHGQGLAVLHPVYYRHIVRDYAPKFARFAEAVMGIRNAALSELALANAGIDSLADFIREMGLPSTFPEMGLKDLEDSMLRKIAASTMIRPGCARRLSPIEILQILRECQ